MTDIPTPPTTALVSLINKRVDELAALTSPEEAATYSRLYMEATLQEHYKALNYMIARWQEYSEAEECNCSLPWQFCTRCRLLPALLADMAGEEPIIF